jgi:hypothetical protein
MKRMLYRFAADAVMVIHFTFILFVLFGGIAVLKWPKLVWVHLPAATWGILIEFFGWWCPLTKWENRFLRLAGEAGYDGGFVSHYIMPVIYPPGLTRGLEIAIGIFVLLFNAAIYARIMR